MIDMVGKRFGRLVVLRREGSRKNGSGSTPAWLVLCDCGSTKVVLGSNMRKGLTRSCGCSQVRHGMFGTPEYSAWQAMIGRCENPNYRNYRNYGGRGIRVCGAWRKDFNSFFEAVGHRPSPAHSLDRIDNNGNYEPENVRWTTRKEQARNQRRTRFLIVNGARDTLAGWADRVGVQRGTIKERLRRGWSDERAVLTPVSVGAP